MNKRTVLYIEVLVLLVGLSAIWGWAIPTALHERRMRLLLAQEGKLARGQIPEANQLLFADPGYYRFEYQFEDATGQAWRGQSRGYLSENVRRGESDALITYAPSDPSLSRYGDWTDDSSRRQMERGAILFPLYILVGIAGGLSLWLIKWFWGGMQWPPRE
jgi:hypothetical protein